MLVAERRDFQMELGSAEQIHKRATELLSNPFNRLVHIFGVDTGRELYLNYFIALNLGRGGFLLLRAKLDRDNPRAISLAGYRSSAYWAEREWRELLGIEFEGHPDPRHLFLPFEWDGEDGNLPVRMAKGVGSFLAIGPYHPALVEGAMLRVRLEGEEIVDVDIKPGFNHRGIMKLAERRDWWQTLYLVERVCGICNPVHTECYVNAVEKLFSVEVPERAKYIRTLIVELNRIQSHLLAMGILAELAGFASYMMWMWKIRELSMEAMEILTGNRVHESFIALGGVRKDVTSVQLDKVEERLRALRPEYKELRDVLLTNKVFVMRTEGVGTIDRDTALSWAVTGPILRGSGIGCDLRAIDRYDAYGDLEWRIAEGERGDVWSRALVFLDEIDESIGLCLQCIDRLRSLGGGVRAPLHGKPLGEAFMRVEAPRGELFYYVVSNGAPTPVSLVIRTPTYVNLPVLHDILKGQSLADIPVILGSLDPCMACLDRIVLVEKGRERKRLSISELAKGVV